MILTEAFWRGFELDLAEIKISYLNWAIGYAREPAEEYRHLFLWPEQTEFCAVNSRYGRAFAISPFGPGVRGVPRPKERRPMPRGLDEIDVALMKRLNSNTQRIRESIRTALHRKDFTQARQILLNFYWLKLGPHELLFDHIQFGQGDDPDKLEKGRWGLDESEGPKTLTGIRNRVVNVIRYGEFLQTEYVKRLNKNLPGFSPGSRSTFLSSGVSWNRYGLCCIRLWPSVMESKRFRPFQTGEETHERTGVAIREQCPGSLQATLQNSTGLQVASYLDVPRTGTGIQPQVDAAAVLPIYMKRWTPYRMKSTD